INGAADLGTYLLPIVGQAKVIVDTAGIGESYAEKLQRMNPFEAAGATLGELGEGMNPFSSNANLLPEERALRGAAAWMLWHGAKEG
ncbi:hypothetical protein ABTN34_18070, partial [Acinetobacter baumannii]